jgi:hypothetical protein
MESVRQGTESFIGEAVVVGTHAPDAETAGGLGTVVVPVNAAHPTSEITIGELAEQAPDGKFNGPAGGFDAPVGGFDAPASGFDAPVGGFEALGFAPGTVLADADIEGPGAGHVPEFNDEEDAVQFGGLQMFPVHGQPARNKGTQTIASTNICLR